MSRTHLTLLSCRLSEKTHRSRLKARTENRQLVFTGNRVSRRNSMHRATDCAIARTTLSLDQSTSVHRATYCAHNYPLPLLPSGPGGVGGITSRRTRHRNHFTTPTSSLRLTRKPLQCKTCSYNSLHLT